MLEYVIQNDFITVIHPGDRDPDMYLIDFIEQLRNDNIPFQWIALKNKRGMKPQIFLNNRWLDIHF